TRSVAAWAIVPLGRNTAAGLPSRSATYRSRSVTAPPSPYRSSSVSSGMEASWSAGRTSPLSWNESVQRSRRILISSSMRCSLSAGQRSRLGQVVALREMHADRPQFLVLGPGLHALGDDPGTGLDREPHQRPGQRGAGRVAVDVPG